MKSGREIGEYRIVRLLGKGGMSEVYEAEHLRLGSHHAIKFFTYEKNVDGVKERFFAEGKLLAKLAHPRVVRVTDSGTDPETHQPYFVMDLVTDPEGQVRSLADVSVGEADELQIGMWYDDLREGLAYIHAKGVIHRDLKLENVLIGPDGHVVLTDFGISKIGIAQNGDTVVDPVQTIVRLRDGKNPVMGSLGYMAPELEMGVSASPQSDYYAVGVIVYRLLTGTWCDARTDIRGGLETYDPVWRQIVPQLLHSNPRARECLSWRELKDAEEERRFFEIENALERSRGKTRREKRRARVSFAVIFLFVLSVAALGVLLYRMVAHMSAPTFEEVVFVPEDAPEEETETRASREQLMAALPDAWVLVHDLFVDLRAGRMTRPKVVDELNRLARRAEQDDIDLFDNLSYDYGASGENVALGELLRAAAERLAEGSGRK